MNILEKLISNTNSLNLDNKELLFERHFIFSRANTLFKKAYCFSVPISNNNVPVNLQFENENGYSVFRGSSAKIIIKNDICIEDQYGSVKMQIDYKHLARHKDKLLMNFNEKCDGVIMPSLNGIAVIMPIVNNKKNEIIIELDMLPAEVRSNKRYLAFINKNNTPRLTLSCIGSLNKEKRLIGPCEIACSSCDEKRYLISISPISKTANYVCLEINAHEPKLFLDTSVESKNPNLGNSFGSVAFVGKSNFYGETWLYSKLNFNEMRMFESKEIVSAKMYIPNLNCSRSKLVAYPVSAYFCSINSNWNNRIPILNTEICLTRHMNYYEMDLTQYLKQCFEEKIHWNGFVIKAKADSNEYSIISTGDNFIAPQFLEIIYC